MIELMNTKSAFKIVVGQFGVNICYSEHCSASAGTAQGYNAKKTARTAKTAQTAAEAAEAAEAAAKDKAAGAAIMQRIAEQMMRPLTRQRELLHQLRIMQEALDPPPIPTLSQNPFVGKKKAAASANEDDSQPLRRLEAEQ